MHYLLLLFMSLVKLWPLVAIQPPDQPHSTPDNFKQVWKRLGTPGHTQPTKVILDVFRSLSFLDLYVKNLRH